MTTTRTRKAKKRNPQDATLRNIRASRTAIAALQAWVKALEARVNHLETQQRAGWFEPFPESWVALRPTPGIGRQWSYKSPRGWTWNPRRAQKFPTREYVMSRTFRDDNGRRVRVEPVMARFADWPEIVKARTKRGSRKR